MQVEVFKAKYVNLPFRCLCEWKGSVFVKDLKICDDVDLYTMRKNVRIKYSVHFIVKVTCTDFSLILILLFLYV